MRAFAHERSLFLISDSNERYTYLPLLVCTLGVHKSNGTCRPFCITPISVHVNIHAVLPNKITNTKRAEAGKRLVLERKRGLRLLENLVGKGEVSAEKGLESGSLGGVLGKDVELQVKRE